MSDWKVIVPEATQNIQENPSFELGTAGWAAGGGNDIARSNERSFKGDYSLKVTYDDSLTLAECEAVLTAVPHTLTLRVYLPAAWDGGPVSLGIAGFTSATIQTPSNSATPSADADQWVELRL